MFLGWFDPDAASGATAHVPPPHGAARPGPRAGCRCGERGQLDGWKSPLQPTASRSSTSRPGRAAAAPSTSATPPATASSSPRRGSGACPSTAAGDRDDGGLARSGPDMRPPWRARAAQPGRPLPVVRLIADLVCPGATSPSCACSGVPAGRPRPGLAPVPAQPASAAGRRHPRLYLERRFGSVSQAAGVIGGGRRARRGHPLLVRHDRHPAQHRPGARPGAERRGPWPPCRRRARCSRRSSRRVRTSATRRCWADRPASRPADQTLCPGERPGPAARVAQAHEQPTCWESTASRSACSATTT